jgi:methionyl-tRNA synthetase
MSTAGIDVPQALYVHGFINAAGGVKMSKSLGNVVAPEEVVKIYGVDALRYYLLRYIPHDSDGDFSLDRVHEVYTADGERLRQSRAADCKYARAL